MNFIRDYKYIIITVFAIIAFGVGLYLKLNVASFYQVDFQISSEQAQEKAASFVSRFTEKDPSAYRVGVFSRSEKEDLAYLEQNIGQKATGTLIEHGLPVFSYNVRFFQFQQKEEFRVRYAPNGELVQFIHTIPEKADKSSVSKNAARQNAKSFISKHTPYQISEEWKLKISETDDSLPNRTDYTFGWERENKTFQNATTLKDASERIKVTMYEGQVGAYTYFMHVPQSWITKFENQQANNSTANTIAQAMTFIVLGIPLLIIFGKGIRNRSLSPKIALISGGVMVITLLVNAANQVPNALFHYPTELPLGGYLLQQYGVGVIISVFVGALTAIFGMTGDLQQRNVFPQLPSLKQALSSSLKQPHVRKSLWAGSVLFGFGLFIVSLYYVIGETYLGFWSPANRPSGVNVAAYIPVLTAVHMGIMAALLEEFQFRLFGISYLKRFVRYTWIAVLITAMIWAFGHSSYVTDPWFVRGIELTIIGILVGWAYVRYGVLSVLSWHFMNNVFLGALALWTMGEIWNGVAGFIIAGLPIILLGIGVTMSYKNDYMRK